MKKNGAIETLELRIADLAALEESKAAQLADLEADLKATRDALTECRAAVEKIGLAPTEAPAKRKPGAS